LLLCILFITTIAAYANAKIKLIKPLTIASSIGSVILILAIVLNANSVSHDLYGGIQNPLAQTLQEQATHTSESIAQKVLELIKNAF
jgi:energy-coupling factor transporter transmembrane protein EcfT